MDRKGVIFAIIIFIVLGLYVFLVERNKPFSEGRETILEFDENSARGLIINQGEKEIVLNKDKDGKWQITSPLFTKADDGVVKELVSDLSNLKALQSLEVDPSEWEDFGLKKPGCEVTVLVGTHKMASPSREEKLSFGDKNPAGTSIYTRMRGKDKIFLASTYIADSFKKDIFDLRDKIILSIDKDKVDKIELIYPEKHLVLEKEKVEEEEKWFFAGKERIELDNYEINDILWALADLKAKGIIVEELKDSSKYGLDKPDVKVIINAEGKENILLLGQKASEKKDTIYASLVGDPRLFLVSEDLSLRLKKDLSDLKKEIVEDTPSQEEELENE